MLKNYLSEHAGAFWMLYSYGVGFSLQGFYFLLIARTLGSSNFGAFAAALALTSILGAFMGLGSGNVLVLRVSRDPHQLQPQLGTALAYTGGLSLLTITAFSAVQHWIDLWDSSIIYPLLISELFFTRMYEIALQSYQALDRLHTTAHLTVSSYACRFSFAIAFLVGSQDSPSTWAMYYAASSVLVGSVSTGIVWFRLGLPKFTARSLGNTWKTGLAFSVGIASKTIYTDADKIMLEKLISHDVAGFYSAAYRVLVLAFAPLQAIVYASNTRLYRAGVRGYSGAWLECKQMLRTIVPYSCVAIIVLVCAAPLLPAVLGADYKSSAAVVVLLAPMLLIQGLHYAIGDTLMGVGGQALRAAVQVVTALLAVLLNFILIPIYSWKGAVCASLASESILVVVTALIFWYQVKQEKRELMPN